MFRYYITNQVYFGIDTSTSNPECLADNDIGNTKVGMGNVSMTCAIKGVRQIEAKPQWFTDSVYKTTTTAAQNYKKFKDLLPDFSKAYEENTQIDECISIFTDEYRYLALSYIYNYPIPDDDVHKNYIDNVAPGEVYDLYGTRRPRKHKPFRYNESQSLDMLSRFITFYETKKIIIDKLQASINNQDPTSEEKNKLKYESIKSNKLKYTEYKNTVETQLKQKKDADAKKKQMQKQKQMHKQKQMPMQKQKQMPMQKQKQTQDLLVLSVIFLRHQHNQHNQHNEHKHHQHKHHQHKQTEDY